MLSAQKYWILLAATLLLAFCLRWPAFYLPHSGNDETFYLALALKLEEAGLDGYNLRHIDRTVGDEAVYYHLLHVPASKGSLLEQLEESGVTYYTDEKVSNMPPLYAALLMFSRNLFGNAEASPGSLYMIYGNLGWNVWKVRPSPFAATQGFAVLPNLLFSMGLILVTGLLGKRMFNAQTGVLAAFLMAISPVDLMTSQRIWADEATAFFILVAFWLLWESVCRGCKTMLHGLSGLFLGAAILSKGSGLFACIFAGVFGAVVVVDRMKSGQQMTLWTLAKVTGPWLAMFSVCALVTSFWFFTVYQAYGTLIHRPVQEDVETLSPFFKYLQARPFFGSAFYFVILQPLFICFYLGLGYDLWRRKATAQCLFLYGWILVFISLLVAVGGREARYLLPAYPALAVVTASFLTRAVRASSPYISKGFQVTAAGLVLLIYTWITVEVGLRTVYMGWSLFDLP